jgi:CubicO group peptidase (beta-lactamase class C family)
LAHCPRKPTPLALRRLSRHDAFANRQARAPLTLAPEKLAHLEALFQGVAADAPGCAVGVVENGETVFARGYGLACLEHGIPITPASRFYMASVSKQVTAMAVLLAIEAGRLDLGESVRKTIPELPTLMDGVTIRHLLAHTGGVRDYFNLGFLAGFAPEHAYSEADVLGLLGRQRGLNFAPGEDFAYSNSGYVLLSIAVARATGKQLDEFARETIFTPLGMNASRFQHDHASVVPAKAFGYAKRGDEWSAASSMLDVVGDGGLYASLEDMLAWAKNLISPRIGAAAIARMQVTETLSGGASTGYGLGLIPRRHRGLVMLEHGGGLAGYRTQLQVYPSQAFGVAVLCNDAAGSPQLLSRRIAEICLADRMAPPADQAPAPAIEAIRARVACYRTKNAVVSLVERDGKLYPEGIPFDLSPLDADTFALAGDPDVMRVAFDAEGGFALTQGLATPERFQRCELPGEVDEDAFVGSFHSPETGAGCRVERSDGSLTVSFAGGADAAVRPIGPDCLWAASLGVTLDFQRDASGAAQAFTANGVRARGIGYSRA